MLLRSLLPSTTALIGALAITAPVAAAATPAPPAEVCDSVSSAGAMAVLGPYGPLGDYGPNGALAGQPNPAASCGGAISFALPGATVDSFVTANLSLAGQVPGAAG